MLSVFAVDSETEGSFDRTARMLSSHLAGGLVMKRYSARSIVIVVPRVRLSPAASSRFTCRWIGDPWRLHEARHGSVWSNELQEFSVKRKQDRVRGKPDRY
jgi:hypothetical protein